MSYQCFVEGCPANHASKREVCTVSSNERVELWTAAALAHRACCGTEHDPSNGKLHGYCVVCVVCGVPWPCDTAKVFLVIPDETTRDDARDAARYRYIRSDACGLTLSHTLLTGEKLDAAIDSERGTVESTL